MNLSFCIRRLHNILFRCQSDDDDDDNDDDSGNNNNYNNVT